MKNSSERGYNLKKNEFSFWTKRYYFHIMKFKYAKQIGAKWQIRFYNREKDKVIYQKTGR